MTERALDTILTLELGWRGAHFRWIDSNNVVRETTVGVEVPQLKADQARG